MRLYRVITEEDGGTEKIDGGYSTERKRMTQYFAAASITAVWDCIAWLRNDPERDVIAIVEDSPAIEIVQEQKP